MIYFLTRLLFATFGAFAAAAAYGLFVDPAKMSTVLIVVPFLLLSIITFIHLQQSGSGKAASIGYLIGLFPFLLWVGAVMLVFPDTPDHSGPIAGMLFTGYLISAIAAYVCLVVPLCGIRHQMPKMHRENA